MVRPASFDKWKAPYDLPEIAKISTGKRRENIKKEKTQHRDGETCGTCL